MSDKVDTHETEKNVLYSGLLPFSFTADRWKLTQAGRENIKIQS